jgi:radical SAM superfamily enzyme YgiQ (UPF0313 family)
MYKDVRFRVVKMDQIEKDLQEARGIYPRAERVFLVNGDAFVLKADSLKRIAGKIAEYFPECKTITMYASIQNIRTKTEEELKELRAFKIDDLYVGVESGSDEVLAHINKGNTVEEASIQLQRLNDTRISHVALLMLGVAGRNKGLENARLTAAFINETRPKLVWIGTLAVFEGTQLLREAEAGVFARASELEILLEEKELIENIKLRNVPFYGVHPTNTVPVSGMLPWDKKKMIDMIDDGILHYGENALSNTFHRKAL